MADRPTLSYIDRPIITTADHRFTITTLDAPGQYLIFERTDGKPCAVSMDGAPIRPAERIVSNALARTLIVQLQDYMDDQIPTRPLYDDERPEH